MKRYMSVKYCPPIISPHTVERGKLNSIFDTAFDNDRHIVVFAMAGSGKSTSAAAWLIARAKRFYWINLDELDNCVPSFFKSIREALNLCGEDAQHDNGFPLRRLLDSISAMEEGVFLVLDNFHLLKDKNVLRNFHLLINRIPNHFKLMLITRSEPQPLLGEQILKNNIALIGASDLEFSADMITTFFAVRGRTLTREEAKKIYDMTFGWVLAIQAVFLSGKGGLPEWDKINTRGLMRLIDDTIWRYYKQTVKDFLLKTVLLDKQEAQICEVLSKNRQAKTILKELCENSYFMVRFMDGYHQYSELLKAFLMGRVSSEHEQISKESYVQAAEVLVNRDEFYNGFLFFLKGEAYTKAEELLFRQAITNEGQKKSA